MNSDRRSAVLRLRGLPTLFSLHDLRIQGLAPGTERNALSRWKALGLVSPVGPRTGRYYNLIADPRGREAHLGAALRAEFGSVVLIGPSVLNDRHWTTQPPSVVTVAVPLRRSYAQVDGAIVHGRPAEWFAAVREAVRGAGSGPWRLPQLPPEWALADMLRHGDCLHGLQPDDIEIPDGEADPEALRSAFDALGVEPDHWGPYVGDNPSGYGGPRP